jgi:dipeptidase E
MDNNKSKKIFISGGGNEKDAYLLDREFIRCVGGGRRKSILYMPMAMDADSIKYEVCYDWIVNSLTILSDEFIDIIMWTNLKDKTEEDINKFDAVYIGGGNTFKLLDHLYESNFFNILREFINNGGIIYGGSAGAIIMGENINTVSEENDKNYKYNEGLSMIGNYSIICHYKENLDKKIEEYIATYNSPVIALSERSGLKINGNNVKVIGYDPIIVFNLKKEKSVIENGVELFF